MPSSDDDDEESGPPPDPMIARALDSLELGSAFGRAMAARFVCRALEGEACTLAAAASAPSHPFRRVAAWLQELGERPDRPASTVRPPSPWQRGCPEIIPHLRAAPWWTGEEGEGDETAAAAAAAGSSSDTSSSSSSSIPPPLLPFLPALAAATPVIREELLALRGHRAFQQYRAPRYERERESGAGPSGEGDTTTPSAATTTTTATTPAPPAAGPASAASGVADGGDWNVFYLELHDGVDCAENQARCPRTMALLRALLPRPYGHTFFSAMAPRTHITPHTGPTNRKLRIHVPLVVPQREGAGAGAGAHGGGGGGGALCRLRVGPHTRPVREGRPFAFDDSFQHEAANDADAPRVTLIADIWHPDLSDEEVKFLSFVRASQMRGARAASEAGGIPQEQDFFAVLKKAREAGADDERVFGGGGEGGPLERPDVRDD
jgi:aspartate beta-hydroxylase